ncbi:hypothetical protein, variant 1 [Exophiala oligosperma]|uniref:Uncharacterized protein n=1 Tax=Exophiala oligosperma TaxID=215243 RepID=A0A0D2DKD8_9EURO|nr:hypothetical protein, variant 1 [Exophiala oligosperma]KIW36209.1 hypothetical protein, variant 1 [Exophiala oligosperma]
MSSDSLDKFDAGIPGHNKEKPRKTSGHSGVLMHLFGQPSSIATNWPPVMDYILGSTKLCLPRNPTISHSCDVIPPFIYSIEIVAFLTIWMGNLCI